MLWLQKSKKTCVKKIIYGIDLNVIVKMVNIYQVLLTIHLLGDKIIETTKTVKIKVFWQKVFQ